jgi:hypothetical protein
MSLRHLSTDLRKRLIAADDGRCAYCHTAAANTGQPMTLDHVIPESRGGLTNFDNLCFACRSCNEFKGGGVAATDPLTGDRTSLFHPRKQVWNEHFMWNPSGLLVLGLTAIGRATVVALNMNNPVIVDARRRWVSAGWHPPAR